MGALRRGGGDFPFSNVQRRHYTLKISVLMGNRGGVPKYQLARTCQVLSHISKHTHRENTVTDATGFFACHGGAAIYILFHQVRCTEACHVKSDCISVHTRACVDMTDTVCWKL